MALDRIKNAVKNLEWAIETAQGADDVIDAEEVNTLLRETRMAYIVAMDDDFNSPKALGEVFDFVAKANTLVAGKTLSAADAKLVGEVRDLIVELIGVFGVDLTAAAAEEAADSGYPAEVVELAAELAGFDGTDAEAAVQALLDARAAARAAKDWGLADAVRDRMGALGFTIMDTPQGARVEFAG